MFLLENKEFLGFIAVVVGVVWSLYKYFDLKNREERRHDYKAYHELIKSLTDGGSALERQVVILYELRNYPKYFEITVELLEHLIVRMEKENADDQLSKQASSTLLFIKNKL